MLYLSRPLLAMVAVTLPAFGVSTAYSQPRNDLLKLTAADAAEEDEFGTAVSISGTTALVGAYADDDAGGGSGSAYLFDTATGNELFKLTADDASELDWFGSSVAISGTTAIVGAWRDDDAGQSSGSAYLFDTTTGQQLFKLTADDAAGLDRFGWSVAISGTTAIVGADRDSDAGFQSGSAYVFDTTTGQQLFKLGASDAAAEDWFGNAVAISGTTAVVGARGNDDDGSQSGSIYVFDTTTGMQLNKFTAFDASAFDRFGWSVAISGSIAIVGAYTDDDGGLGSGSAYLFDTATGLPSFKLVASDAEPDDRFGNSVGISGNTAVVGAQRTDDGGSNSGSAYVFDTTIGQQFLMLAASDAAMDDVFGAAVAISGNFVIGGASRDDDGGIDSGSAYLFDVTPCPADVNGDGIASPADFTTWLFCFNSPTTPRCERADINRDGAITPADFTAWLAAFNDGCP